MSKPIVLNRDRAKFNPEGAFNHPEEVVTHVLLTYAEKLAILERWKIAILSELAATGEGMATHGVSARRLDVLATIQAAKATLERAHAGG